MGTFIHELGHLTIPDEKWPAFLQDALRVLDQGGMFSRGYCSFMGKDIWLLRSPTVDDDVVDVVYNYFEDDFWENAGVSIERHDVYSGKIGWSGFNKATQSLYYLAELYSSTLYATGNDSRYIAVEAIQWLRYVLKRELHYGWRTHIWDLCELEAERNCRREPRVDRGFLVDYMADDTIPEELMSVATVTLGLDEFVGEGARKEDAESKREGVISFVHAMIMMYDEVKVYKATSDLPQEEQIQFLFRYLKRQKYDHEEGKKLLDQHPRIAISAVVLPPPASVKVIAEIYERNFWELWEGIRDDIKDREAVPLNQDGVKARIPYAEMSTEDFFNVTAWDRLYWWRKGGDVELTEEIKAWLKKQAERHRELTRQELPGDIAEWQKRFVNLLSAHQKVCCFEELFFEFMGNFHSNMMRAAIVLLEETASDKKEYRRLIAVMANRKLRYEVFLF